MQYRDVIPGECKIQSMQAYILCLICLWLFFHLFIYGYMKPQTSLIRVPFQTYTSIVVNKIIANIGSSNPFFIINHMRSATKSAFLKRLFLWTDSLDMLLEAGRFPRLNCSSVVIKPSPHVGSVNHRSERAIQRDRVRSNRKGRVMFE